MGFYGKVIRRFIGLTVILISGLSACRNFDMTTIVLQEGVDGYSGTRDAHLQEFGLYEDRNTGGYHTMEAGRLLGSADDADKAIVIAFDLSSIPRSALVYEATMELYFIGERGGIGEPKSLSVHMLTEPWIEGEGAGDINGQNVPGVDWLWLAALPPKFSGEVIQKQILGATADTWYSFDITSAVRDWVRGDVPNHGVIILEDNPSTVDGTKQFRTSEYSETAKRPKLAIRYQQGEVKYL